MNFWLWVIIAILILVIVALSVKVYHLQKAADEITIAFAQRLSADTNVLIDISCRDRHMRRLAGDINIQLKKLRSEQIKFQQGNLELKNAVTNISHDLRTPLTAICGYLDLLEKENKSPQVKLYLDTIRERTQALVELTGELFRYTVVSSVINDTKSEDVELNRVLEESISAHYALIKNSGINPDIYITDKKIVRRLNKNAISRIFQNVISNAVKYTDGDLRIELNDSGEITFSNHASNLDKVTVEKLFDRFYTVETADKSTGLGLSIAKILTRQMNGSISAVYDELVLTIRICF